MYKLCDKPASRENNYKNMVKFHYNSKLEVAHGISF